LACEWLGTALARRIGLRTFDVAIILVTEDDEIPLASGRRATPGPATIARSEKGSTWGGSDGELDLIENTEDISRLVVFDTWVRNCDRHPANLEARKPNLDNVFLSREGASEGRLVLKAVDHTHVLTCGRDITAAAGYIDKIQDEGIYGLFPQFKA